MLSLVRVRPAVSRRWSSRLVAYAFVIAMMGGTLPAPLYVLYQQRFALSTGLVSVIYAAYVVGVLGSLLLLGHASDEVGRRPVLLGSLALMGLGALVFAAAGDLAMLLAGRVLAGLGAGVANGAATAALIELAGRQRRQRAARLAASANSAGLALGPLLAGPLAQYLPWPTRLVFAVYLALLATAALCLLLVPETVAEPVHGVNLRFRRLRVPRELRRTFAVTGLVAFSAFAVTSLFSALAPSLLRGSLHETSHALAGAVVALSFGSAAVVNLFTSRLRHTTAAALGLGSIPVALALVALAIAQASLPLFLVSALVGGSAVGLAFAGSLGLVNEAAPPERRGALVSAYFLVAYAGLSVPALGLGFAAETVGALRATEAFGVVLAVLVAVSAVTLRAEVRRGRAPSPLDAWTLLERAHAATTRAVESRLSAQHALTLGEYETLRALADADGRMPRPDLARELSITTSAATRRLEALERFGLVENEPSQMDGSAPLAVLTDRGRRETAEATETHDSSVQVMFGRALGGQEMRRLTELLDRLRAA